ncbi:P-loop containing nucleoside triphosphate hydrolase protein [Hypoxylon argillaceum]|nr:P-loop containing nucleoside triphosphate hydrolase protein [Hypoxylon argillaceum]
MATKSPGSLCTVIISGGAGIGKSSLALEVAHAFRGECCYDAILWINAENRDVLRESFTKLALRLLLKDALAAADKDFNFMLMKNWMYKTWLLIYDNVQDFSLLKEYLPPDTGSMIVTSRFDASSYGMAGTPTRIQLQKFNYKEALELFNKLRRSRDSTCDVTSQPGEVRELLESVDGLALGIKQMAFYIASKRLSITRYQEQYSQMTGYILGRKSDPVEKHSLGTLWNIHFQDIHGSNASKLLGILSLAHPDAFPVELLEHQENEIDSWASFCADPEELERAIDSLKDKALVEAIGVDGCISIHRLTQQAFIHNSFGLAEQSNLPNAFEGLLSLIFPKFPTVTSTEGLWKHWAECSRYIPQVSAMARTFRAFKNPTKVMPGISPSPQFLTLMISATWYLFEIGEMAECKELLNIAIDACEDKEGIQFAWLCNTFASVAIDENDHETARLYCEKAISIREAKLEPTAIDLVNSYNNYGNALNNECRYDEAINLFMRAYTVLRDIRVGEHSIIYSNLTCLNMARSYALKGDTEKATSLLQEVEAFFAEKGHKNFLINVCLTWSCYLCKARNLHDALLKLEEARALAKEVLPYGMMLAAIHIKLGIVHKQLGLNQGAR